MNKNGWLSVFGLFCFLSSATADAAPLKFGVVPQFAWAKIERIWGPILDSISTNTGIEIELVRSDSIPEFEKRLLAGDFDLAYANPWHCLIANLKKGYVPLIRDTGRKLSGILVVKRGSSIEKPDQLSGKTVAFPAANALAASLVTRAYLGRDLGLEYQTEYLGSHDASYLAVVEGRVDAAGGVPKTLSQQPSEIRDELRIIYSSKKMNPHAVVAHKKLSPQLRKRLLSALLSLGTTREGAKLLSSVPIKKIGEASIRDYKPLMYWGLREYYVQP